MPVKPLPKHITCPSCHWSTVYAPPGDALMYPVASKCPKCGNDNLVITEASATAVLADRLRTILFGR